MGEGEGFCPYCGHTNPPEYRFCIACRRPLPSAPGAGARPTERPPPAHGAGPRAAPAVPEGSVAESAEGRRSWYAVPLAIGVAVAAVLAGLYLVHAYLPGLGAGGAAGPPLTGHAVDLCNVTLGANCVGHAFTLPAGGPGGSSNTTGCDRVPGAGSDEQLWLNLSSSSPIDAIVLPELLYSGPTGWTAAPWRVLNDSTLRHEAAWIGALVGGSATEIIPLAGGVPEWCLGWWEPGSSAVVTWTTDVMITYAAPR